MLEPRLAQNADGLWLLTVRRQGEHGQFDAPYIGSEALLADAELGLIVVLVSYHGAEPAKYGRLGYLIQKGQFYRYYRHYSTQEYLLGQRLKNPARPRHGGGFYSYPTLEIGAEYLADCVTSIPFHREVATPQFALLECEVGEKSSTMGTS